MRRTIAGSGLVAALACPGCVPRDAGYQELRGLVRERSAMDIRWRHVDDDAAIDRQVDNVLAKPIGPDEAVQIAILNSPDLQAALEGLGVARAKLLGASVLPNPEVEGRVGFVEGADPELGFTATENLSRLILLPMRRGVADAELGAARFRAAGAALALAYDVRTAFYEYQAAEQFLALTRTVLEATAASYDLAERLHEAGNITDLDFARERAFHEETRFAVADAEVAVVERREALNHLMGLSGPATEWRSAGPLTEPPEEDPALPALERRAIERSLELRELEQRYLAAGRRANLARADGLLPDLRAGVAAEREEQGWEVGPVVVLEVPLFDQGQGPVGVAKAEMRQVENEYAGHAIRVRSAVRAAQAELVTAGRRARYYREVLVPLRAQIVAETQRQYNAMQVGAFELISAREAEVRTGRDYVASLGRYWRARATLDQLLAGRLVRLPEAGISMGEAGENRDQEGGH